MRLMHAISHERLRVDGSRPLVPRKETKTAIELAREVFAEAEEREQPFMFHSPESWARKWLPSGNFRLVRMPLNAAAMPCQPKIDNLVLKKIHAMEDKPIIVDYNRNQVGKSMHGFVPQTIVIDGKHRFKAAMLRGETHIMAWVGELAASDMKALGSGGGGPAPERTTPAPGAKLNATSRQEVENSTRGPFNAEGGHVDEMDATDVAAYGTSEGAMAGWDTRGRRSMSEAQDHGYAIKSTGKDGGGSFALMQHHKTGDKLTLRKDGSWQHELSGKVPGVNRYSNGRGPVSLVKHLGNVHLTR